MNGISFIVSTCIENVLGAIFASVECGEYWWNITEDEIYNKKDELLFKDSYIDGKTFENIINTRSYQVIFANIQAYPPNISPNDIETYEDFIRSQCQLILFCSDVIYYEIYSKEKFIIDTIRSNAIKNGFHNVEYITSENDQRNRFSVK